MLVLKSRWLALAAICLTFTFIAGCQIDGTTGVTRDRRFVKVSPDMGLQAAPEGHIYELWILSVDQEIIQNGDTVIILPRISDPTSVVRFNWDPYLYAATDAEGDFLPLTIGNGMQLTEVDVNPFFNAATTISIVTVEPINDPNPEIPDGPTLVAQQINQESGQGTLLNSWAVLQFFNIPPPSASFSLLSQSNKKGVPDAEWRDDETEGLGIWFVSPRLQDTTALDSVNAWDAYTATILPPTGDAYSYSVWIHKVHPESSFSNFGLVYANREPNFEYRDGVVTHAAGRFGPGVPLGEDPVSIDGTVVGYRYISPDPDGIRDDTCIVRIDNPALTKCNSDPFDALVLADTSVLPKTYRTTNGDTNLVQSLAGLLDVSDIDRLNEVTFGNGFIFLGWEYEAWLMFTEASGIPPLSLGRFKAANNFDSGNPYTYTDSRYDQNFRFPGEDFLQNLSSHHPALSSPLDVIHDPRVEKLWITIEPDDDFGFDWSPETPNTQLVYLSAYLPKDLDTTMSAQIPLIHRDLNPSVTGLNNGHFFPTITVRYLPPATD